MRFNADMYCGVGVWSSISMAATCTTGKDSGLESDFIGSFPAETAHAWGLVQALVPEGQDALAFALEYLAPIANGAPLALSAALEAIDRSFDEDLRTGLDVEALIYDRLIPTRDRREALAAFGEKRKPVFEGR